MHAYSYIIVYRPTVKTGELFVELCSSLVKMEETEKKKTKIMLGEGIGRRGESAAFQALVP